MKARGNASRARRVKATAGCARRWSSAPGAPSGPETAIWQPNITGSLAGAATRKASLPWATPSSSSRGTFSGTAGRTGTSDTITSTDWTETGSFVITPAGWRTLASSCPLRPRHRQLRSWLLSEDLSADGFRTRAEPRNGTPYILDGVCDEDSKRDL